MRTEQERIQQRRDQRRLMGDQPIRFWMPFNGWMKKGTRIRSNGEREIVVLDAAPDFFRYEHACDNPETRFKDLFLDCIDETDTCPVCENTDSRPYYALYLSVIDLEPYVNKQGEEVAFTRKLFVVKSGMQRSWARMFEREGSLRGAHVKLIRDTDKDPVVGNEIELIDFYEEDDLSQFVRSFTDRQGKVHEEDCSIPYDYDKLFPEVTKEELEAAVGAAPTPGSRQHEATVGAEEDDDVNADWEPPTRSRRGAKAADVEVVDDDEVEVEDDDPEEVEDEAPPARRRAAPAAERAVARRARPAVQAEEEVEAADGEEEEPEPAPTARRRAVAQSPAAARRSRR